MDSAQRRTLPLFEGEEPAPPKPRKPSVRTLRTRLWKATLKWWQTGAWLDDDPHYEAMTFAAMELEARMKE